LKVRPVLGIVLALALHSAGAQSGSEMRSVTGRLLLGSAPGTRPLAGMHVVLHRIGPDSAGPVDSMRTAADGSYRFRYRWSPDSSLYIVSARYQGIAYFTAPLRQAQVSSPEGDVLVYDTTSRPIALQVRGRHLVLTRGSGSLPRVFDVLEIANDSSLTLVAGSGGYTWETLLPSNALRPSASGGDIPPQTVVFAEGRARVTAPFSPGVRQLVLSYEVTGSSLSIPLDTPISVLELLVEEGSGGVLRSAPLQRQEDVSLEGRRFQRYLGLEVQSGSVLEVALQGGGSSRRWPRFLPVLLAALALVLGTMYGRRAIGPKLAAPVPLSNYSAAELARATAAIDFLRERKGVDPATRSFLEARRAELMQALRAALAAERRTL
jgi:hypothetical protein